MQQLGVAGSPAEQEACLTLEAELSALLQQQQERQVSRPARPALRVRFLMWRGRLQAQLGRPDAAAASLEAAAAAAQDAGMEGARNACLVEAAAARCSLAEALEAAAQPEGALQAALAGLEAAHACTNPNQALVMRAATIGARQHVVRASQPGASLTDLLPALQLYVLALKQVLHGARLPLGVRPAVAERMAEECAHALKAVRPLYAPEGGAHQAGLQAQVRSGMPCVCS